MHKRLSGNLERFKSGKNFIVFAAPRDDVAKPAMIWGYRDVVRTDETWVEIGRTLERVGSPKLLTLEEASAIIKQAQTFIPGSSDYTFLISIIFPEESK